MRCPPESARLLLSNLNDPKSLWQGGKPPSKLVRIVHSASEFQIRFTTNELIVLTALSEKDRLD